MRIGIVGSAGSGKSTLALDLAQALGAPVIEDITLRVLREEVGRPTWVGIRDTRIRHAIRLTALERKIEAENAAASFVSDKTVVDYAAYWLKNQAEFETLEQTRTVLEKVKAHVPRYDVCVFLPYRESIDFAEGRSNDPIHNLRLAALKRGLLTLLGATVVDAPYTFGEDVEAWIARWLTPEPTPLAEKRGPSAGKKAKAKAKAKPSPKSRARAKPKAKAKAKPKAKAKGKGKRGRTKP
ncbi:AAA family ATPase [Planctomycetota bacterium]